MADACDRVEALFGNAAERAADDDALRALLPELAGLVTGARTDDERHVYAGAVTRLTHGLGGGPEGDDPDDDEDDA